MIQTSFLMPITGYIPYCWLFAIPITGIISLIYPYYIPAISLLCPYYITGYIIYPYYSPLINNLKFGSQVSIIAPGHWAHSLGCSGERLRSDGRADGGTQARCSWDPMRGAGESSWFHFHGDWWLMKVNDGQ